MNLFQSLVLAVIQGITEFLPVSSSGHLNLFQHLFGFQPSLTFDIFLNTASLLSVLVFFRHDYQEFIRKFPLVFLGSIPAALIGILYKDQIELVFANTGLLPLLFLITAVFLLTTKFIKNQSKPLNPSRALFIGVFQSLAILPAVSRSGSTIFAALLVGLSATQAFRYSFFLFIPASFGAILLDFKSLTNSSQFFTPTMLISFITCFFVGILSLRLLQKALISNRLWVFGIYCLFIAALSSLLFFR